MSNSREFDLVVFGATGFTGQLVVKALKESAQKDLKWAIAGRREDALKKIAEGTSASVIICDSGKVDQCKDLAERTGVVLAMAGPFALIGRNILKACVDAGTDYADITGETMPFVRDSIRDHHDLAIKNCARIVHCCGYDSVPSDLMARKALNAIRAEDLADSVKVLLGCDSDRTDVPISGGSVASGINMVEYLMENRDDIKNYKNPYSCGGEPSDVTAERKKA